MTSVFCRNLFYGQPYNTEGLTYQGIFFRTGNFVSPLKGDYLEFGVFDGRTMSLAYYTMGERRLFGFDTFSGIIGKSKGESMAYEDGNYYSNIETFIHNMNAACVHIDCDVYMAAKAALNFCTNLLQQGSVLLFDEFHGNFASNKLGERRALKEWLEENPHIHVERWHDYATVSRAFIVHVD